MPLSFWSVCIITVVILMPPLGSGGSVIIFLMSLVGWIVWARERGEIGLIPVEKWAMAIICFYFFTALFCAAIKAESFSDVGLVWNNLGLIFGLSLFPVLRSRIDETWFDKIVVSVAVAGILLALITQVLLAANAYNLELFSGNALILAYLAGLNAVLGLTFFFTYKRFSLLSLLGIAGSIFALIITGRRGPVLAVLIALLPILIVVARHSFRKVAIILLAVAVVGTGAIVIKGPAMFNTPRLNDMVERLADPFNPAIAERSIYLRLSMYQDGLAAFKKAPILGYGRQNITQAAAVHGVHAAPEFTKYNYSHLHNALITEAVSSGVLGIIGLIGMYLIPILVSWRGPPIVRLMGLSYAVYFLGYTSTNIGFYHDVTVFSYLFIVTILNALANGRPIKSG